MVNCGYKMPWFIVICSAVFHNSKRNLITVPKGINLHEGHENRTQKEM